MFNWLLVIYYSSSARCAHNTDINKRDQIIRQREKAERGVYIWGQVLVPSVVASQFTNKEKQRDRYKKKKKGQDRVQNREVKIQRGARGGDLKFEKYKREK